MYFELRTNYLVGIGAILGAGAADTGVADGVIADGVVGAVDAEAGAVGAVKPFAFKQAVIADSTGAPLASLATVEAQAFVAASRAGFVAAGAVGAGAIAATGAGDGEAGIAGAEDGVAAIAPTLRVKAAAKQIAAVVLLKRM